MRTLIMAAGSVGGYFGGLLAKAGNDVLFVARGDNLDAIRRNGIRCESVTSGDFVTAVNATDRLDGSWKAELVLFCVKSYHNADAMPTIAPAVDERTAILTLQNGLGGGDELATYFGAERVMLGAAYVEAAHPAPGEFRELGGDCRIVFAEPDERPSARASRIAATLADARIDCEIADDIQQALWNKLVFICGLSGMTCITRSSFERVMDTPATARMTRDVMTEAAAVGRAAGVAIADDLVDSIMQHFVEEKSHLISSMHADLTEGRPMEYANLNGRISELGGRLGEPTPLNDFITACLTPAHESALAAQSRRRA